MKRRVVAALWAAIGFLAYGCGVTPETLVEP
jgi:hypothetical protein